MLVGLLRLTRRTTVESSLGGLLISFRNRTIILLRVTLKYNRYFHGFLSEQKAEHRLKELWESTSNKQSYYVVRFSESDVGALILTFIDYIGHIQHEKIINRNGMWYVEGLCEEFDAWKKVKSAFKQVWNIGVHLPKSPYQGLFKKKRL